MKEIWKPIPNWPYEASSHGRVRKAVATRLVSKHHIAPQYRSNDGYMVVTLYARGTSKRTSVNRLVCTAFYGPDQHNELQAAHKNGVRDDNRLDNLRWATLTENCRDRVLHGTQVQGEKVWSAVLTEDDVRTIRQKYAEAKHGTRKLGNGRAAALAADFGISTNHLLNIVAGRAWRHVS